MTGSWAGARRALVGVALVVGAVACGDEDPPQQRGCSESCAVRNTPCTRWTCEGRTCVSRHLEAGSACGNPSDSTCNGADTCDGAGSCVTNIAPRGTACGDSTDTDCDAADTCDGAGRCVTNVAPLGASCGSSASGACDLADSCDGVGTCLPNFAVAGTACGDPSSSTCDHPDTCDGAGTCVDNFAMTGTPCGNPTVTACNAADTCDGAGTCQANMAAPDTPCGAGQTDCATYACNAAGICVGDFQPFGTACGDPTSTTCSDSDICNGAGQCAPRHADAGVPCGSQSSTTCDQPDRCNGLGACDPSYRPAGYACGNPASSECDLPDRCDGMGSCDPRHVAQGTPCGSDVIVECSAADSCDGSGTCEPNDVSDGTPCDDCLAGAGWCDDCGGGVCLDVPVLETTCFAALSAPTVGPGTYAGYVEGWSATYDDAECTYFGAEGPEAFLPTTLAPGELLEIVVTMSGQDGVPYFITGCPVAGKCLNTVDNTGYTESEILRYYNATGSPMDLIAVFDSANSPVGGATWFAEIASATPAAYTIANDCAGAGSIQPLMPGDYIIDARGFTDTLDVSGETGCLGYPNSPGVDALAPVLLAAGATIHVTIDALQGDPAVYLLAGSGACQNTTSCIAGNDVGGSPSESVTYTNSTGGAQVLYVVFDSTYPLEPGFPGDWSALHARVRVTLE